MALASEHLGAVEAAGHVADQDLAFLRNRKGAFSDAQSLGASRGVHHDGFHRLGEGGGHACGKAKRCGWWIREGQVLGQDEGNLGRWIP